MMTSRNVAVAAALAMTLGLAMSAPLPAFAAQQSTQNNDHSSDLGEAVSDTWITTKVKAELATTDGIENTNVSVDTNDGVVTLTGVLPNDIQVKKAVAAAKSVKGVKKVDASGLKAND